MPKAEVMTESTSSVAWLGSGLGLGLGLGFGFGLGLRLGLGLGLGFGFGLIGRPVEVQEQAGEG